MTLDPTPQNLPFRLLRTAQAMRTAVSRRLEQAFGGDFSADYWFVLETLQHCGDLCQADLARELSRDGASIMRTVNSMERMGLLTVVRDSRRNIVKPTPMAIDFMPKAEKAVEQALSEPIGTLKPFEIIELSRILDSIFNLY